MIHTEGANPSAKEKPVNSARPIKNTRLLPYRSASAPAAIRRLPKASMKALVIGSGMQAIPESCPIAGVATAPAEKFKGRVKAARHTATNTEFRLAEAL